MTYKNDKPNFEGVIGWEGFFLISEGKKIRIRIDSEFAGHRHVFTEFDLRPTPKYIKVPPARDQAYRGFNAVGSTAERDLSGK
jgi:hypothetical protein